MSEKKSILEQYPDYKCDIGIEVHVQLTTKSKIFCSCKNEVSLEPNKNICEVCSGYPGVLPVLNKEAVNKAILLGLATNSKITPVTQFARKHYFYPDLPKNYQITQSDKPICAEGFVEIKKEDGSTKKIRLIRIHMEEDAGKNIHAEHTDESFVNLNRTGTPLLEVVTYPDIESAYEAREYLKNLRNIVQYLDVCTGNMEEGAFRGDTNISVRLKDSKDLGTKCELKNINSFKFIHDAIEYEIERQIELVKSGGKVKQETRLWDEKNKKTIVMRSKEEAADYRYLDDPDLPIVEISEKWISDIRSTLPELPTQKLERFTKELNLSEYEAEILVNDRPLAKYFEEAYKSYQSKQIVNWILRDVCGYIKDKKIEISELKITPSQLASIIKMQESGKINNHAAKIIFEEVAQTGKEPEAIVKEKGLEQIGSADELEKIILEVLSQNPKVVEEYKSGKDKLFGFFVGQVMKLSQGKGDPKMIQELLKKNLQ